MLEKKHNRTAGADAPSLENTLKPKNTFKSYYEVPQDVVFTWPMWINKALFIALAIVAVALLCVPKAYTMYFVPVVFVLISSGLIWILKPFVAKYPQQEHKATEIKEEPAVEEIEIPVSAVSLRSIMETDEWRNSNAAFPIAFGKDETGKLIIHDLAQTPNLLIEGTANSYKPAFLRTLLLELIFGSDPCEHHKHIVLIDDKKSRFEKYQKLPSYVVPTVHKSEDMLPALAQLEDELNYRRRILERYGFCRKITPEQIIPFLKYGSSFRDREGECRTIILIISELADVNTPEASACLQRILDFGRYVGIYVILATDSHNSDIISDRLQTVLTYRVTFQDALPEHVKKFYDEEMRQNGDLFVMRQGDYFYKRIHSIFADERDIKFFDNNKEVEND